MKEIADILKAYHKASKESKRTALATVVKVVGSSYRRPGARMLITEDGQLTGAISGGCLEGDALRKALSAIHQQENKLVTYDTTDEDDAKLGIQLGCNGIVHILFEPVKAGETSPLALLSALESRRENSVLVTLFSLNGGKQPGTSMLYRENSISKGLPAAIFEEITKDAGDVLNSKTSSFKTYRIDEQLVDGFLEFISPPVMLVIAGAGNDAQPLAEIADLLGWEIIIADGRPAHCSVQRFPRAGRLLVGKPDEILPLIEIDEKTAFVLMTHNYNYDIAFLNLLLDSGAPYIGSLGPRTKLLRMLDELGRNSADQEKVHGPVGLDIGAETAEEIAVSIIAEIKAYFAGASAKKLKEKKNPIHYSEMRSS